MVNGNRSYWALDRQKESKVPHYAAVLRLQLEHLILKRILSLKVPVARVVFVILTSLEIQRKQRPSGPRQTVNGFGSLAHHSGCQHIAGAAGEAIKKLFPPGGDWKRLESSHQNGLAGIAELHQGAQLCKILPLFVHGGDWEMARGAMRDLQLQSPVPWPEEKVDPTKGCYHLGEQETSPSSLSLSHPLPTDWALPASSKGAPDTSLLCERLLWDFLPARLFTAPGLRPDVCSLLSANWQTEASRALVWSHQTPVSSGSGVLPQTVTSVASGHPRTSSQTSLITALLTDWCSKIIINTLTCVLAQPKIVSSGLRNA